MRVLLRPFALLYGVLTTLRNALYDAGIASVFQSDLPVISIGNATVGGTGKTPLTLFIAAALRERGHAPVILSRGYGARVDAPKVVFSTDSPPAVGDEPLLMSRAGFPVVVSPDRAAGARLIQERCLGSLILLDDGLQHRRLARRLDIVTVDCSTERAVDEFEAGALLPEGWFRERREGALKRAGAVILNHRVPRARAVKVDRVREMIPSGLPVFESYLSVTSVTERSSGVAIQPRASVVAFCALGNPDAFFSTVEYAGFSIVARISARDHAAFSAAKLSELARQNPEAALLCSAKDAVKLPADGIPPVYVLNTELEIDRAADFIQLIESRI